MDSPGRPRPVCRLNLTERPRGVMEARHPFKVEEITGSIPAGAMGSIPHRVFRR